MKTIFVPIDFSDATEPVLRAATELAQAIGARVVLANVIQPLIVWDQYATMVDEYQRAEEQAATAKLEQHRRRFEEYGIRAEIRQFFGSPARELAQEVKALQPDYLVVGSHGHTAFHDLLIGSTAAFLLRHVTCPILVVPVRSRARPAATPAAALQGAGQR